MIAEILSRLAIIPFELIILHIVRDISSFRKCQPGYYGPGTRVALSLAYERLAARPRSAPNRRFLRHAENISRRRGFPAMPQKEIIKCKSNPHKY